MQCRVGQVTSGGLAAVRLGDGQQVANAKAGGGVQDLDIVVDQQCPGRFKVVTVLQGLPKFGVLFGQGEIVGADQLVYPAANIGVFQLEVEAVSVGVGH